MQRIKLLADCVRSCESGLRPKTPSPSVLHAPKEVLRVKRLRREIEEERRKDGARRGLRKPDCTRFASTHVDLTARQFRTWEVILFRQAGTKCCKGHMKRYLSKAYEVIFPPIDRWFDLAKKRKTPPKRYEFARARSESVSSAFESGFSEARNSLCVRSREARAG